MNWWRMLLPWLMTAAVSLASVDVYQFDDEAQEARFQRLVYELRCPKCQNNNLHDSDARIAKELKAIIYEKIKAGESDEAIVNYLRARYGDFISYRPPLKPSTWFIWFGPFLILAGAGWVAWRYVHARRRHSTASVDTSTVDAWADDEAETSKGEDE
jgi:cytochrome c-type biogenesis protein CcmH